MSSAVVSRLSSPRWFIGILLCYFAILSVHYTLKAEANKSAFERWRPQILDLFHGINIYQVHEYPNPPIMALLLRPLAELPSPMGSLCWFYLKVGMTLLTLALVFGLIQSKQQPFPPGAKAVTVLLSLRPITGDLTHGNINLFILFLVVVALFMHQRQRRFLAGVVLALSIACKVTPALFIPYFLWKRSWRALAGCGVGLVLFLWLVPGSCLTFSRNSELLLSWHEQMVAPFARGVVTSEHQNQSLAGVLVRLLTDTPSFLKYVNDKPVGDHYHNLVSLRPTLVAWLVKGCMGLFALLIVWTCRSPLDGPQRWQPAAEFGLVFLGMLLFSERTWKHHCVTLVVPFAVLCYCLAVCPMERGLRGYLTGSLALVAVLMLSTSTGKEIAGAEDPSGMTHKLAEVYGVYAWANLVLVAALMVVLRRYPVSAAEPSHTDIDRGSEALAAPSASSAA